MRFLLLEHSFVEHSASLFVMLVFSMLGKPT